MTETKKSGGLGIFMIIWVGQFVSLLGTGMTNFGLPIWIFEQTGRATDLTTIMALFMASLIIASPFTGVLVDRSNRKLMMMLSDLAAGLVTVGVFILFVNNQLEIWHLYVSAVIQGTFQSFQWPAFSAAISVMLNKEQYTRAATLLDLANNASQIFAPIAAGALLGVIGLRGILLIDIVTFSAAVGTLLLVPIPNPPRTAEQEKAEEGGFIQEVLFGFRYIFKRPSLLGLQTIFMLGNMVVTVSFALMAPMILSRTGSNELIFGSVQSISAIGGVLGGVIISAWGGFKRRVHGVLTGWMLSGFFGVLLIGLGRPDPAWMGLPVWAAGGFIATFLIPLINGSNQAIWQSKVSPDVQGKVFSIRRLIAWVVIPLSQFIAGPLADQVLEPAMQPGGSLAGVFGWLVGSGPGAGMSLTFVFTGLLAVLVGASGYLFRAIRDAEDILPDHDLIGVVEAEESGEEALEPDPAAAGG